MASWTDTEGVAGAYVSFGRAPGCMDGEWRDVHGTGAQRSDPKDGNSDDYPTGLGPRGDAIRIYNDVRLVSDARGAVPGHPADPVVDGSWRSMLPGP